MSSLVAYFSAQGNTKKLAEKLASEKGFDLFEIEPKEKYTKEDLNWMDNNSRTSKEMKDNKDGRPEIVKKELDLSKYDTIYLGFPIWWYIAPTIINTFLESYDFTGKRIVLFATSGGSGFGKAIDSLKNSAAGAIIEEGKVNPKDFSWIS